jgi:hypothetical protein
MYCRGFVGQSGAKMSAFKKNGSSKSLDDPNLSAEEEQLKVLLLEIGGTVIIYVF